MNKIIRDDGNSRAGVSFGYTDCCLDLIVSFLTINRITYCGVESKTIIQDRLVH